MLLEIYIQLAMTYIYTRLLFGQAFLELDLFIYQAVIRRCSAKKMFLKISRNSQEIISATI